MKHEGWLRRSLSSTARRSKGTPASTTSCRARTTLRTSPASMAARIRRTDSVHTARPGSSRTTTPTPGSRDPARAGWPFRVPRTVPPDGAGAEYPPLRGPIGSGPGGSPALPGPVVVTQRLPSPRRTTTTAGTTSEPGVRSSKGRAPTAIGPAPGPLSPTGDGPSTAMDRRVPATAAAARSKRPGPATTGTRAATPAVTNPAPARSQANPSGPRTSRRSATSAGASARVRLTSPWSGAPAGSAVSLHGATPERAVMSGFPSGAGRSRRRAGAVRRS